MTITRIVRSGRIVGLAGLAALGCAKSGTTAKPMADAQTPNTIVTPATAAPPVLSIPPGQDPRPAAEKSAREFLTALNEGKATPAQLADGFKKVVAPPVLPSDKEKGYSDLVAGEWLKQYAGRVSAAPLTAGALTVDTVVVTSPPPAGAAALPIGRTVVRVVKAGAEWKVDWLHQAPPAGTPEPLTGEGDDLAARFAAAAFVETTLAKGFDLAETLVAPATKARLAPSLGGEDAARGYNRSILRSKLENFRGGASSYAVAKKDVAGSAATVTGELLAGADQRRPFVLKLTRGTKPGEWLVEEFDPR